MSLKVKLTSLIITFILLCSLLIVGVFAVKNTTLNVSGKIEFTVDGIEADIKLTANGVQNAKFNNDEEVGKDVLSDITIRNTSTKNDIENMFSTWSNLNMTFAEGQSTATIELVVTNKSEDANNFIDITAHAEAAAQNNAKINVVNNAGGIVALLGKGDSATFTITFSVVDDGYKASLNNFLVDFDMKKISTNDVQETVEGLTIEKNATAKTASITGNSLTGEDIKLVLPKYVLHVDGENETICAVTSIKDNAFYDCDELVSIDIPDSVISLEEGVFQSCEKLQSIKFPDGLTSISGTYEYCSNLSSIFIGSGTNSIEAGAFSACGNLKSITVSKNNLVYDSRNNCNAIIKTATNELIQGASDTIIPDSVTSIGEMAFNGVEGFTTIEIPNSVKSIGSAAFATCKDLTSLVIPDSVTEIGEFAFAACSSLTNVKISKNLKIIKLGAFQFCETLTSIELPEGVTNIEDEAFYDCSNLKTVTIPRSLTSIGADSFYDCDILTINYRGTKEQWDKIEGLADAGITSKAKIECDYTGE